MPADEHVAILLQGTAAWNEWRQEQTKVVPALDDLCLTLCQKQWTDASGGCIDFSGAHLRRADFRFASLMGADLRGADLSGADFSTARLRGANFEGANLSSVCFAEADVTDAKFAGADLRGTDLSAALNLKAEQLSDANGDGTTLLPPQLAPPSRWHPATRHGIGNSQSRGQTPSRGFKITSGGALLCGICFLLLGALDGGTPAAMDVQTKRATRGTLRPTPPSSVPRLALLIETQTPPTAALRNANHGPGATSADKSADKNADKHADQTGRQTQVAVAASAAENLTAEEKQSALQPPEVSERLAERTTVSVPPLAATPRVEKNVQTAVVHATVLQDVDKSAEQNADKHADQTGRQTQVAVVASAAVTAKEKQPALQPPEVSERLAEHPTVNVPPRATPHVEKNVPTAVVHDAVLQDVDKSPEQKADKHAGQAGRQTQVAAVASAAENLTAEEKQPALQPPEVSERLAEHTTASVPPPAATPRVEKNVQTAVVHDTVLQDVARQTGRLSNPLIEYLNAPKRDDQWIRTFVEKYYLSGDTLDDSQVRQIYAEQVAYFGTKTMQREVAKKKVAYYRHWPNRSYTLIPGTLTISWKSAVRANIVFLYRFKVTSRKKLTSVGRGRAVLTLDFSPSAARIVEEDGKVLANSSPR